MAKYQKREKRINSQINSKYRKIMKRDNFDKLSESAVKVFQLVKQSNQQVGYFRVGKGPAHPILDASKLIEQASATQLRSHKALATNANTHSNLHSKGSQRQVSRFFKARLSNKNYHSNTSDPTSHLGMTDEELNKNLIGSNVQQMQIPKH